MKQPIRQSLSGERQSATVLGTLYALAAFGTWGLLPLYWKLLKHVAAIEILAHRVIWSCVFVLILLLLKGQWNALPRVFASRRAGLTLFASSILVSLTWFTFIWGVNTDRILETSMGYYMSPLLSILFGLVLFREKMNFWQYLAVAFAFTGVMITAIRYGRIPWIALTLAFSFSLYGLLKKTVQVESLIGLGVETLFASPLCALLVGVKYVQGTGAFGLSSLSVHLLLIVGGVLTALPLLWFSRAAKRIPLSRVGFLQYIAPTVSLLLGVIIFHEPFTWFHGLNFGCIWLALLIYSLSETRVLKNLQPKWSHPR